MIVHPIPGELWAALGVVVSAALGWLGKHVSDRRSGRSADWQGFTDDLRSDIEALRAENAELRAQVNALWQARTGDQSVITAALSHIAVIETGVLNGTVPPLPDRPALLQPVLWTDVHRPTGP